MNIDHVCDGEPEVSCNKCLLRREQAENAKLRSELETVKDDKALLWGQLQQSRKQVADADIQIDNIRNVNHDLADMVRCLEWTDPKGEVQSHCPWCEVQKPDHEKPCKLKMLIDKGYVPNKPNDAAEYFRKLNESQARAGVSKVREDLKALENWPEASKKCKATLSGIHWATSIDGLCPACGEKIKT